MGVSRQGDDNRKTRILEAAKGQRQRPDRRRARTRLRITEVPSRHHRSSRFHERFQDRAFQELARGSQVGLDMRIENILGWSEGINVRDIEGKHVFEFEFDLIWGYRIYSVSQERSVTLISRTTAS